uniref:NADH-ubiquinone oxidoreductase chain 2 n=1 Tax=Brillia brevicornis TaxID=2970799 RepID=A0A976UF39_9DIPT|nr:NADH dehydrogenase subunit 2 [Brillia brevicornis]UVG40803.1 NADH dehydrogenase subunit 2 [Brillia brevicornis]
MFKNSYKNLFFFMLISGTMISISSSSWFAIWMGLEINLLSIIPLMMDMKNLYSSEATLKYFLTQALASSVLLFSVIMSFIVFKIDNTQFLINSNFHNEILNIMLISSLMLKSGAAPFHFWFPNVMEGISWFNNMILMTWQKIAPIMLMSYCLNMDILLISIILSSFFGSIGGLNQMSLRKLMAFSSINHLSWMMTGLMKSESLWFFYFVFYCFLSLTMVFLFNNYKIFYMNQMFTKTTDMVSKFIMMIPLLSLGGLPPFLGFFPKWMIIEHLISLNSYFILFVLMMFTLITLFFYLRICYSSFLLSAQKNSWEFLFSKKNNFMMINSIMMFISCFGFILINLIFFLL